MPAGIYIDHGNGLVLDMTQRFGTFVGYLDTNGGTNGTLSIPSLKGKDIFHIAIYNGSAVHSFLYGGVSVTFNKSTGVLSWTYLDTISMTVPIEQRYYRIYYGAF